MLRRSNRIPGANAGLSLRHESRKPPHLPRHVLPGAAALADPDRSVRSISGHAPGGLNAIVSRGMAAALTPILGQPAMVENRAGAGGRVGAAAVC